jgi:hypothetical protein
MNNELLKVGVWEFWSDDTSFTCILCQQPQTPRDSVLGFMGQLIISRELFMTASLLIVPNRT